MQESDRRKSHPVHLLEGRWWKAQTSQLHLIPSSFLILLRIQAHADQFETRKIHQGSSKGKPDLTLSPSTVKQGNVEEERTVGVIYLFF